MIFRHISRVLTRDRHITVMATQYHPPCKYTRKSDRTAIVVLRGDRRGVSAVELAFTLPILLTLMMGTLVYGQYFFVAHNVQQAANNGARAAIAGLDRRERERLAERTVRHTLSRMSDVDDRDLEVEVSEQAQTLVVEVHYLLPADNFMRTSLVPVPSNTITGRAAFHIEEDS